MNIDSAVRRADDERGLGLLEIVISMFLISLIAIAFVPVLMAGLRASEFNSTTATATRLVSQAIDDVQSSRPDSCAALAAFTGIGTLVDAQGVALRTETAAPALSDCVTGDVNLVSVTVSDATDTGAVLAEARTLVFIPGAP